MIIPNMWENKKCSKPPTSPNIFLPDSRRFSVNNLCEECNGPSTPDVRTSWRTFPKHEDTGKVLCPQNAKQYQTISNKVKQYQTISNNNMMLTFSWNATMHILLWIWHLSLALRVTQLALLVLGTRHNLAMHPLRDGYFGAPRARSPGDPFSPQPRSSHQRDRQQVRNLAPQRLAIGNVRDSHYKVSRNEKEFFCLSQTCQIHPNSSKFTEIMPGAATNDGQINVNSGGKQQANKVQAATFESQVQGCFTSICPGLCISSGVEQQTDHLHLSMPVCLDTDTKREEQTRYVQVSILSCQVQRREAIFACTVLLCTSI